MKIDELLLLSGNDIPFLNGQCIIHQPTLNEISYITQETFWTAYETLKFDKSSLSEKDLKELENISNFKLIINFLLVLGNITKRKKMTINKIITFKKLKMIFYLY